MKDVDFSHDVAAEVMGYIDGTFGLKPDTAFVRSEYRPNYFKGFMEGATQAAHEQDATGALPMDQERVVGSPEENVVVVPEWVNRSEARSVDTDECTDAGTFPPPERANVGAAAAIVLIATLTAVLVSVAVLLLVIS